MSRIIGHDASVSSVLSRVLIIPDYQRDYSWTPKREVKSLLDDFADHLEISDSGNYGATADDDYLLGPIIMTTSTETPEVIDGQQRIITLYLIASVLRRMLISLRPTDGMIRGLDEILTRFDQSTTQQVANIRHHDADVVLLLTQLATDGPSAELPKETGSLSRQRVVRAFKYIATRLQKELPNTADGVSIYAKFLREYVKLIEISTPDIDSALYVFERANDRGKPLDPSDLLKNLIFRESDSQTFDGISTSWKRLQLRIDDISSRDLVVQLMDYLRWVHLGLPEGFYSTRRNFYSLVSQPRNKARISENPAEYVRMLDDRAGALARMASARRWPDDTPSPALEGIYAMAGGASYGGGRQKQQWPLVMAASHLTGIRREAVARAVEKLLLVSYVTQLKSQSLEALVRKFTEAARSLEDDDASVVAFTSKLGDEIKAIMTDGLFENRFLRLNYLEDKAFIRYVFVRIHSAWRKESYSSSGAWPAPLEEVFEHAELDHIWPQHDGAAFAGDEGADTGSIHNIGNLALVDVATNRSAGGKPASAKLTNHYRSAPSDYLVVRNLHERQDPPGENTRPKQVVSRMLTGFSGWGPIESESLASFYLDELRRTMPDPFLV